ncbi:hypothetical protein PPYR_12898 [Photinus pyralis]|uniref:Uncharacterized protein n=1 Tax=Photinus pyralis TaxID=7054 RepID=A0A5N4A7Q1_PHOPY|nr:hypothetical protein PPYR_12898 [Photinus pyralis]
MTQFCRFWLVVEDICQWCHLRFQAKGIFSYSLYPELGRNFLLIQDRKRKLQYFLVAFHQLNAYVRYFPNSAVSVNFTLRRRLDYDGKINKILLQSEATTLIFHESLALPDFARIYIGRSVLKDNLRI